MRKFLSLVFAIVIGVLSLTSCEKATPDTKESNPLVGTKWYASYSDYLMVLEFTSDANVTGYFAKPNGVYYSGQTTGPIRSPATLSPSRALPIAGFMPTTSLSPAVSTGLYSQPGVRRPLILTRATGRPGLIPSPSSRPITLSHSGSPRTGVLILLYINQQ